MGRQPRRSRAANRTMCSIYRRGTSPCNVSCYSTRRLRAQVGAGRERPRQGTLNDVFRAGQKLGSGPPPRMLSPRHAKPLNPGTVASKRCSSVQRKCSWTFLFDPIGLLPQSLWLVLAGVPCMHTEGSILQTAGEANPSAGGLKVTDGFSPFDSSSVLHCIRRAHPRVPRAALRLPLIPARTPPATAPGGSPGLPTSLTSTPGKGCPTVPGRRSPS